MPTKDDQNNETMRLDKWLWCARFYKTRGLAAEAIKTGKIKIKGDRVKPARMIRTGEELLIRRGPYTFQIVIISLTKQRRSAAEAALLFEENAESIATRVITAKQLQANNAMSTRTKGRPSKRERRSLTKFKQHQP